jgi:hypothetical protein
LTSYAGLSQSSLIALADAQGGFSKSAPAANWQQASQDVQAAAQATDPNLQAQLIQDAINLLTPTGASGNAGSTGGASPAASPSATSNVPQATPSPLSVNGNSVNTGLYTITGSTKDDGSLTITNNQTGQSTEVWGDPHVNVNGQTIADFQKDPMNIQLQDGTVVHIDPTSLTSNGVSHIGQVSITKGDDSVTMGGVGANGFEGGVNTSQMMTGVSGLQTSLYNSPNAIDLTLGADGNLYHNNANGSMGAEVQATNGGQTDLDGSGGGMVDGSGGSASGASSSNLQALMNQLMSLVSQNEDSFSANLMQTLLQQMMSHSGYQSAAAA